MTQISDIENETFMFHHGDIGMLQATHVTKRMPNDEQVRCVHLQIWFKFNSPAVCYEPTLDVYVDDEVYENLVTELRDL